MCFILLGIIVLPKNHPLINAFVLEPPSALQEFMAKGEQFLCDGCCGAVVGLIRWWVVDATQIKNNIKIKDWCLTRNMESYHIKEQSQISKKKTSFFNIIICSP